MTSQDVLALGTHDKVYENLCYGFIGAVLRDRQWVLGNHIYVCWDFNSVGLIRSGENIGYIHDSRISFTKGHLRDDAFYILLV